MIFILHRTQAWLEPQGNEASDPLSTLKLTNKTGVLCRRGEGETDCKLQTQRFTITTWTRHNNLSTTSMQLDLTQDDPQTDSIRIFTQMTIQEARF